MSWDIRLGGPRAVIVAEWNLTFNLSSMIAAGLEAIGHGGTGFRETFEGMAGDEAKPLLVALADELDANEGYDALAPANGWGDRANLIEVLSSMADAVPTRDDPYAECAFFID